MDSFVCSLSIKFQWSLGETETETTLWKLQYELGIISLSAIRIPSPRIGNDLKE